jgi:hypothetical protein
MEAFEKTSSKSSPVLEEELGRSKTEVFQRAQMMYCL